MDLNRFVNTIPGFLEILPCNLALIFRFCITDFKWRPVVCPCAIVKALQQQPRGEGSCYSFHWCKYQQSLTFSAAILS